MFAAAMSPTAIASTMVLLCMLVVNGVAGVDNNDGCVLPYKDTTGTSKTLDLSPLKRKNFGYIAVDTRENNAQKYRINVCAPVPEPGRTCGVCLGDLSLGDASKAQLTRFDSSAETGPPAGVILTLNGGDPNPNGKCTSTRSRIRFSCGLGRGEPVFIERTITSDGACTFIFDWRSDVLCLGKDGDTVPPTGETNCVTSDPETGNVFDLSPLIRTRSNWRAIDNRGTDVYEYDINVCRPLVADPERLTGECQRDGVVACQINRHNKDIDPWSLGGALAPKFINGAVVLQSVLGTSCKPGVRRSMRIELICSPKVGLGHPVFREELEDSCIYVFDWHTSTACPVREESGNHCAVTDYRTGYTYNLNPLYRRQQPYKLSGSDGHDYEINICGAIPAGTSSCPDGSFGACQHKTGSNPHGMGHPSTNLTLNDGALTLEYKGGSLCKGQHKRSTVISFVCGSLERPVFASEEDDCTYNFVFPTRHACHKADPVSCVVYDDASNSLFDLTPLTRSSDEDNWRVTGFDADKNPILMHINVCADLTPRPPVFGRCADGDAACLLPAGGGGSTPGTSLGHALPLRYDTDLKAVVLEYATDDAPAGCPPSARITVTCNRAGRVGTPKFEGFIEDESGNNCGRTALGTWSTASACAIEEGTGGNCRVADPATGHVFDFAPLIRKKPFEVKARDGYTYQLSLCVGGGITECPGAAGCQTKPESTDFANHDIGKVSDRPKINDGIVTLSYPPCTNCEGSDGVARRTEIEFVCDHDVDGMQGPEFVFETNITYYFKWRTSRACQSEVVDCTATAPDGSFYDLSRLGLTKGNWDVGAPDGVNYELNVCRGLVRDNYCSGPKCKCIDAWAACQVTQAGVYSLGFATGPQIDPETDGLFIEYQGGQICHGKYQRSTRIDFACDPEAGLGQPRFVREENDCTYRFVWRSAAACKAKPPGTGDGCTVIDPVSGQLFNLTSLSQPEGYSLTDSRGYKYSINVCEPLSAGCGKDKTAAGCQTTKGGLALSTGQGPSPLLIDNGQLKVSYVDGTPGCRAKKPRTTEIIFLCDPDVEVGAPVFQDERETCHYVFVWETALACPAQDEGISCEAINFQTDEDFDLSPLVHNKKNWIALDNRPDAKEKEFQLNVCRNLVRGSHSCRPGMAGCGDKTINYGKPSGPEIVRGELRLRYTGGDKCPSNAETRRSAVIHFKCPRDEKGFVAGVVGVPELEYESEDCRASFKWTTSYACPLDEVKGANCKVTDVLSGDKFDLSALARPDGYKVSDVSNNHVYTLNVCGAVANAGCEKDVAVCQTETGGEKRSVSAGKPSSEPSFDAGQLTLTMGDGTPCRGAQHDRSTVIEFMCDEDAAPDAEPIVKFAGESEDCTYRFLFYTHLACHTAERVECVAVDEQSGAEFDLSSLSRAATNWVAADSREDNKYLYQLSVCRTLVPDHRFPDCVGSSACQVESAGKDGSFLERKLGQVASPQIEDGALFIRYENGNKVGDKPRSTRINFFCGSTIGEPVFLRETPDFEYVFTWTTSAACSTNGVGPTLPPGNGGCLARDPSTGLEYDLSSLKSKGGVSSVQHEDFVFELAVCGNVECSGATAGTSPGACQTDKSGTKYALGVSNEAPHVVGGAVQIRYAGAPGDTSCKGNPRKTLIIFECSNEELSPDYVDETEDCTYVFRWRTPAVCESVARAKACAVTDFKKGVVYDLSPLVRTPSPGVANWQVIDVRDDQNLQFRMNVCGPLLDEPGLDPKGQCRNAGICQFKGDGAPNEFPKALGEMRAPYLRNGVITLEYLVAPGPKSPKCAASSSRKSPKAIVTLSCKPGSIGAPVFENESDCVYLFTWATSAACPREEVSSDTCRVEDPVTGTVFDLSPLGSKNENTVVTRGAYDYALNVCNSVIGDGTPALDACSSKHAGACQLWRSDNSLEKNLGTAGSARLTLADGALSLRYTGGDVCHEGKSNQQERSTVIDFVCPPSLEDEEAPYFVEESDDCSYSFSWATDHACIHRREVECLVTAPTGEVYDLSQLALPHGRNYEVKKNDDGHVYTYSLNVCRALGQQPSDSPWAGCDPRAGVCQSTPAGDNFNLGGVAVPEIDAEGNLVMIYAHGDGDHCPGQETLRTSKITFRCGASVVPGMTYGQPVFIGETKACEYDFEWVTPAACKARRTEGENCRLTAPDGRVIDLNALGGKTWHIKDEVTMHEYDISACGPVTSPCPAGTGACQTADNGDVWSMGAASKRLVLFGANALTVRYEGGDACSNGNKRSTTISFVCEPCATPGTKGPAFLDEETCAYGFAWPTSLVCTPEQMASADCGVSPNSGGGGSGGGGGGGNNPTPAPGTTASPSASGGTSSSIGIVMGVVIAVLVLGIAAYVIYRRKRTGTTYVKMDGIGDFYDAAEDRESDGEMEGWD